MNAAHEARVSARSRPHTSARTNHQRKDDAERQDALGDIEPVLEVRERVLGDAAAVADCAPAIEKRCRADALLAGEKACPLRSRARHHT